VLPTGCARPAPAVIEETLESPPDSSSCRTSLSLHSGGRAHNTAPIGTRPLCASGECRPSTGVPRGLVAWATEELLKSASVEERQLRSTGAEARMHCAPDQVPCAGPLCSRLPVQMQRSSYKRMHACNMQSSRAAQCRKARSAWLNHQRKFHHRARGRESTVRTRMRAVPEPCTCPQLRSRAPAGSGAHGTAC